MELKLVLIVNVVTRDLPSNCTNMELKRLGRLVTTLTMRSSNCTNMELKLIEP